MTIPIKFRVEDKERKQIVDGNAIETLIVSRNNDQIKIDMESEEIVEQQVSSNDNVSMKESIDDFQNLNERNNEQADLDLSAIEKTKKEEFEKEVQRYIKFMKNPDPLVPNFRRDYCRFKYPEAKDEACRRMGWAE